MNISPWLEYISEPSLNSIFRSSFTILFLDIFKPLVWKINYFFFFNLIFMFILIKSIPQSRWLPLWHWLLKSFTIKHTFHPNANLFPHILKFYKRSMLTNLNEASFPQIFWNNFNNGMHKMFLSFCKSAPLLNYKSL